MVDAKSVWSVVENPSVAEKMRQQCPCLRAHVGAGVEDFPPVAKDDRGGGWGLDVGI
jgi:hypothetical protein